jgi:hypothetical protein
MPESPDSAQTARNMAGKRPVACQHADPSWSMLQDWILRSCWCTTRPGRAAFSSVLLICLGIRQNLKRCVGAGSAYVLQVLPIMLTHAASCRCTVMCRSGTLWSSYTTTLLWMTASCSHTCCEPGAECKISSVLCSVIASGQPLWARIRCMCTDLSGPFVQSRCSEACAFREEILLELQCARY